MTTRENRNLPEALQARITAQEQKLQDIEREKKRRMEQQKILKRQLADLNRKARTNRLCMRGGMIESFLGTPEQFSNDQVMELLTAAFRQPVVEKLLYDIQAEMIVVDEESIPQMDDTVTDNPIDEATTRFPEDTE